MIMHHVYVRTAADHMSQPVDTTLSAHVTTDDSEHKNGTDQDQSSNKALSKANNNILVLLLLSILF